MEAIGQTRGVDENSPEMCNGEVTAVNSNTPSTDIEEMLLAFGGMVFLCLSLVFITLYLQPLHYAVPFSSTGLFLISLAVSLLLMAGQINFFSVTVAGRTILKTLAVFGSIVVPVLLNFVGFWILPLAGIG
jgi:hypothetical protein